LAISTQALSEYLASLGSQVSEYLANSAAKLSEYLAGWGPKLSEYLAKIAKFFRTARNFPPGLDVDINQYL
jgi:hypothetical protein